MIHLLLLGPVTKDTIRKDGTTYKNVGGATYYQSAALTHLGANVTVAATLAPEDRFLLDGFHPDTVIVPIWTEQTMEFENIYPDPQNPNLRTQRANIPCNPILPKHLQTVNIHGFDAVYILPLSPDDIPLETVHYVASFRKPVFIGAQGYLRHLCEGKIVLYPWLDFQKFAPFANMLFVDDTEARCIMEAPDAELPDVTLRMASAGINEVIVTRGDRGALIVSDRRPYIIPAFAPDVITDPTGLGDTYMAAYTLQRLLGAEVTTAGEFAATTATMKLEYKGAFQGNFAEVEKRRKMVDEVSYRISLHSKD